MLNSGTLTLGDNTTFTVASTISGNGALAKAGVGQLTLTGNNTYTGGNFTKNLITARAEVAIIPVVRDLGAISLVAPKP